MKREISVLIPVFNKTCCGLIAELALQLSTVDNLNYEILIIDDGSTDKAIVSENAFKLNQIEHCRYIIQEENKGRAATRNLLGQLARYQWLLFLDSGVYIDNPHFIQSYLDISSDYKVIYGGIKNCTQYINGNLRYIYEKKYEQKHAASKRSRRQYQAFRTTNFMIEKSIFCNILFDKTIKTYGYEDVLFGKNLHDNNVEILHIDNGVRYIEYDNNATFIKKTEESLHTLHSMKDRLKGYSGIISIDILLTRLGLKHICQSIFDKKQDKWRDNLLSDNPSLIIFNLYRIGYFISIEKCP